VPRASVARLGETRPLGAMPEPGHPLAALGAALLVQRTGMIDRTEVLALASEVGLQARVVEKDYVLGEHGQSI
jgi:hypothetical protein